MNDDRASPLAETGSAGTGLAPYLSQRAVGLLLGLVTFAYLVTAMRVSAVTPLWLDEVLAVWTARLPSAHAIIWADYHGSDALPPSFSLMLHYLIRVFGNNYLVLRLPQIGATVGSGFCLYRMLRRSIGQEAAAAGMVLFLLGVSQGFAIQVRPYALVTFCYAFAAMLWQGLDINKPTLRDLAGICLALIMAFSLHFYAALFIVCFGLMEALWTVRMRRVRPGVWIALAIAGIASFLWLPLIMVVSRINMGDVRALDYYARPTFSRLGIIYIAIVLGSPMAMGFMLSALASVQLPRPLKDFFAGKIDPAPVTSNRTATLAIALCCSMLVPLVIFVFAVFVIKTFNLRYCLAASLGASGAIAWLMYSPRAPKPPVLLLMGIALVLIPVSIVHAAHSQMQPPVALLPKAANPWPIVVSEGLEYFQLVEAAPGEMKNRIYYIDRPPKVESRDPTNENLVDRWHVIDPGLHVSDLDAFQPLHPDFYVLCSRNTTDNLTPWLQQHGMLGVLAGKYENFSLYEAHSAPASGKP